MSAATPEGDRPETHDRLKPLTIVLVEDDEGDALAVERAFRRSNIANPIVRAVDGMEALEILRGENGRAKPGSPYLILVDVNMPRVNGIDFVKEVRKDANLRGVVVFILTTSRRDEDIAAAYSQNVAGYILKSKAGEDFLNLAQLFDCYRRVVEIP